MKKYKKLILFLLCLSGAGIGKSQSGLLYQFSVNFPAFGLPGYRLGENLKNIGLSAGITYPFKSSETLGLRFDLGYLRTRSQGRNFYLQSQFSLRPRIGQNLETGFDLGIGYQLNRGNGSGWLRTPEGNWQQHVNQKGLIFVPLGLHLGYRINDSWRPFVQYQAQVMLGYNEAFPVFPAHLFSIGQTFKF